MSVYYKSHQNISRQPYIFFWCFIAFQELFMFRNGTHLLAFKKISIFTGNIKCEFFIEPIFT